MLAASGSVDYLVVSADASGGGWRIASPQAPALHLEPLVAALVVNGERLSVTRCSPTVEASGRQSLTTEFGDGRLRLEQRGAMVADDVFRLESQLVNDSSEAVVLNRVGLLELAPATESRLGHDPSTVRIFEQSNYQTRMRRLEELVAEPKASGEDPTQKAGSASNLVWVSYDPTVPCTLLVGFETSERWLGKISTSTTPEGDLVGWSVGFDGGDLLVESGEHLQLEDVLLLAGPDPWELLEKYADLVASRHGVEVLPQSPVSWCSWYPYRLAVTAERVLANAEIAAERLKPLGLSIIEVDLGWGRDYLPSSFEENDQFPGGLAGLNEEISALGLKLGAWSAPFSISEYDPMVGEHPEWLLGTKEQQPYPPWSKWYWPPHGEVYALDLTHPEAQQWLRGNMRSLAERGVHYFKADFTGITQGKALRVRHNPHIVAGGGTEATRTGFSIFHEELRAVDPEAVVLNCGGPELPGKGASALLYTCGDTDNTGMLSWAHMRNNYGLNVAGHLFKHKRWGIIQPSCLCTGLPGTLEEARARATATFMSGGQVDISDDLTMLPEDRWPVLLATLPPLGDAARPVDLFDPIAVTMVPYRAWFGEEAEHLEAPGPEVSRVWHLPVATDWDEWDLVALFNYDAPPPTDAGEFITRFELPLERVGLNPEDVYWAYEFWAIGRMSSGRGTFSAKSRRCGRIPPATSIRATPKHSSLPASPVFSM